MQERHKELDACDYPTLIEQYGKDMLIKDCLGYIDKSVWDLQGKELTPETFVTQFIDLISIDSQLLDCI
jgi:hypothetical protein